jgi:hypothetical protein
LFTAYRAKRPELVEGLTAHRLPFTLVFPWFLVTSYLINNLLRVEKESQEKKAYNGQKSEHHCPVFGQDPEKPATDDCDYTENDSYSDFSPHVHLITPPFDSLIYNTTVGLQKA